MAIYVYLLWVCICVVEYIPFFVYARPYVEYREATHTQQNSHLHTFFSLESNRIGPVPIVLQAENDKKKKKTPLIK